MCCGMCPQPRPARRNASFAPRSARRHVELENTPKSRLFVSGDRWPLRRQLSARQVVEHRGYACFKLLNVRHARAVLSYGDVVPQLPALGTHVSHLVAQRELCQYSAEANQSKSKGGSCLGGANATYFQPLRAS